MHGRYNVKSYCNKCRGDSEGVHSVHWNALTDVPVPGYCAWLFVHGSILKVVAEFVVIFKPQGLGKFGNLKEKDRKLETKRKLRLWNTMINYNDIHLSVESDAPRFLNGVKMCKEIVGQDLPMLIALKTFKHADVNCTWQLGNIWQVRWIDQCSVIQLSLNGSILS